MSSFQYSDMRKVAVLFGVIEAVADHEAILDREADVFDLHVDLTARRLAQEARGSERPRPAGAENVLQIREREPGVDDILDDDHVLAIERRIEILEQADFAGAR